MAAMPTRRMNPLSEIKCFIQETLADHLNIASERVNVIRRNRTLSQGDFQVPLASLATSQCRPNCDLTNLKPVSQPDPVPQQAAAEGKKPKAKSKSNTNVQYVEERLKTCPWDVGDQPSPWKRIKQCNIGKDKNIYLSLSRKEVFSHVLKDTTQLLSKGESAGEPTPVVMLNCAAAYNTDSNRMKVDDLRALLLQEHIEQLLVSNGFCCQRTPVTPPSEWVDICSTFGLLSNENIHLSKTDFLEHLRQSKYRVASHEENDMETSPESSSAAFRGSQQTTFDLIQYVNDKGLPVGKDGFDRNIKQVLLPQKNITEQLNHIENYLLLQEGVPNVCLHLVSRPGSFHQQQLHILWQMAVEDRHTMPKQLHLVHGEVYQKSSSTSRDTVYVDDYYRLRKMQMEKAFLLKYGEKVQGPGWEDTVTQLTTAAIKFELLTNTCNSEVKIDMTPPSDEDDEDEADFRSRCSGEVGVGVFVMYNYARLATLLDNFDKAVQQGVYPPIPDVEELDFQTLREEEEWGLLFNYMLPYRTMVADTVKGLMASPLKTTIQTHKVCQYLHDLSRDLSSYYSRVHVLVENRRHLLPVVHARVCLLRGVYGILRHALGLLGVNPLSQL